MIRAGMLRLGLDRVRDWNTVPDWLAPLDQNAYIVTVEERRDMKASELEVVEPLFTPTPVRVVTRKKRPLRSVASPYLG